MNFDPQAQRMWPTNDPDGKIRCRLGMKGKVTLGEFFNHFNEHYPDIDFWNIELAAATVMWEDEPTETERRQRAEWSRKQHDRTEAWERKTYARLRAKFEGLDVMDVVE
jgi:hypothetical protein